MHNSSDNPSETATETTQAGRRQTLKMVGAGLLAAPAAAVLAQATPRNHNGLGSGAHTSQATAGTSRKRIAQMTAFRGGA
jgi:hypothetical protein